MCVIPQIVAPAAGHGERAFKAMDRVLYRGEVWRIVRLSPLPDDRTFFSWAVLRGSDGQMAETHVRELALV